MKTALLILALNIVAFAQNPSLGELARQERARQKTPSKIAPFTNATLGTDLALPPPPEPDKTANDKDDKDKVKSTDAKTGTEGVKPSDAKADAAKEPPKEPPKDEAYWRSTLQQARDDVKRAEDRAQVSQLELNKLNIDLLSRSDIYNREGQLGPQINSKNQELAAGQKEVEQAHQKLNQLEDEMRRSGAPPGWAR